MLFLTTIDFTLPLTNPVLKFLIILLIILFAPIILNRFKIPHILGLIIAGAVIGPHGFNLLLRDSSIILSGTAGLLYIMFLAGLEIDLNEFKKNSFKSLAFGLMTFSIPMIIGIFAGLYLLRLPMSTSVLLASMFASHTLIAYPIISKLGITNNRAVNITVGGTMITDTLALLVLAVIVGMTHGEVDGTFWTTLSVSLILFGATIMFLFPVIARWFFKHYSDSLSQYIFVLSMVFLGAVLAELAGIEAIIGAFLAGLALNRLIPAASPLMNRIEFIGNAIFIPFFLIGVGMLIDFRVFFNDLNTIWVATVMTVVATVSKYAAAWLTQKTFRFSRDERGIIFGLSNAQAAATLAAVLVGYNIILGHTDAGEPIRLLNDSILNGTIVMILITCSIATFSTQRAAHNISLIENAPTESAEKKSGTRILIPVRNPETIEDLIQLGIVLKPKSTDSSFIALNIINNNVNDTLSESSSRKLLHKAADIASAADIKLNTLLRYDVNYTNGILSVIKENNITDLIMGLHQKKDISESLLGKITEGILTSSNTTTFIYKPMQPIGTIKRHIVVVPDKAEHEMGFPFWMFRIWSLVKNTGSKLIFFSSEATLATIKKILKGQSIEVEYINMYDFDDFLITSKEIKSDDNISIVMSRKNNISYHSKMDEIPLYLNRYFSKSSFILIYPIQNGTMERDGMDLTNPTLVGSIEKLDVLGRNIAKLFKVGNQS
jgi:Kef-type K+ transport system membrane component KefB/nucleotide-binding universal stress UspA family protein